MKINVYQIFSGSKYLIHIMVPLTKIENQEQEENTIFRRYTPRKLISPPKQGYSLDHDFRCRSL